ncbi:MAG: iron ABC transporter permease, partial [Dethiosulfovibrio sp.]|nr:iron ABC transporter permease [Dethiosulfovibrio sp.]
MTFVVEGQLSGANIAAVMTNWYDRLAFFNSLRLAGAVAVTGTFLGFLFALAVTKISMPRPIRWFIGAITVLPLISPPFTSSIALTLSLGPNGI